MEVEFYSPESLFIAKWKVGNPISITQVKEKKNGYLSMKIKKSETHYSIRCCEIVLLKVSHFGASVRGG